jgi:hypothetical protein
MALTGHLSDLSLSELIEFFCNQRKTGQLKVLYPAGAGYFFLQTGSVVHAQIGVLRGIDAVYYALTLPNAKFEFSASNEVGEKTINQPWTQVVLEGLRRLDEGIAPLEAFPPGYTENQSEDDTKENDARPEPVSVWTAPSHSPIPAFLSFISRPPVSKRKPLALGAVGVAVVASVAVIGVPAGWYRHNQIPVPQEVTVAGSSAPEAAQPATEEPIEATSVEASSVNEEAQVTIRKPPRERKTRAERNAISNQALIEDPPPPPLNDAPRSGPRRVVVTVIYDESGRVTQASGGDATALRIARQKRFPAGKAGSATVTIPIN